MTYLPKERADQVATKGDIDRLEDRFDLLEDRFDRLEDRFAGLGEVVREQQKFYLAVMVGSMTALTGIFSVVVGFLT